MDFNTSFAADVSDTGKLELNIGGIEIGTEVYGGGSCSAYGDVALSFTLSDWRLPTTINVNGDVKLGGGIMGVDSISTITFNANETNISGVVEIQSNGSKYSQFFMARDNGTLRLGGLKSTMRSDGKLGAFFTSITSIDKKSAYNAPKNSPPEPQTKKFLAGRGEIKELTSSFYRRKLPCRTMTWIQAFVYTCFRRIF